MAGWAEVLRDGSQTLQVLAALTGLVVCIYYRRTSRAMWILIVSFGTACVAEAIDWGFLNYGSRVFFWLQFRRRTIDLWYCINCAVRAVSWAAIVVGLGFVLANVRKKLHVSDDLQRNWEP